MNIAVIVPQPEGRPPAGAETPGRFIVFDYAELTDEVARSVLQSDDRKRRREQVAIQYVIGRELISAKAALPHGMSGPWLQIDFGSCRHSRQRYLRADEPMFVWAPDHNP